MRKLRARATHPPGALRNLLLTSTLSVAILSTPLVVASIHNDRLRLLRDALNFLGVSFFLAGLFYGFLYLRRKAVLLTVIVSWGEKGKQRAQELQRDLRRDGYFCIVLGGDPHWGKNESVKKASCIVLVVSKDVQKIDQTIQEYVPKMVPVFVDDMPVPTALIEAPRIHIGPDYSPEAYQRVVESIDAVISGVSGGTAVQLSHREQKRSRTLLEFPQSFYPLAVVAGDRREGIATIGNILAYSASPSDLAWLVHLGLPLETPVISDKVVVERNTVQVRELLGESHLLVIGSLASNFLARHVNETAFFRFMILPRIVEKMKELYHAFEEVRENEEGFRGLVNKLRDEISAWLVGMSGYALGDCTLSSASKWVWSYDNLHLHEDCGLVTLGRNPYARSSDRVAVFAAGRHAIGTLCAMKMLSHPAHYFAKHSLGGTFRIALAPADDAVKKVYEWRYVPEPQWITEPYEIMTGTERDLVKRFEKMTKELRERKGKGSHDAGRDEELIEKVEQCIRLIHELTKTGSRNT